MLKHTKRLLVMSVLAWSSFSFAVDTPNIPLTSDSNGANDASDSKTKTQPPLEDIQRFTNAISLIKNYYIEPVTDKKLFENAIRGMLQYLDPHSAYLDENDYKDLNMSTKGQFSGLGLEVTMEDGLIKVISPLDDGPAAKAGIKAGDRIILLDNQPVKGMSLRDAVNKMRGAVGTKIRLTIIRDKSPKPLVIDVTRQTIEIKSVKGELLSNKYAYVRISHFQENTSKEVLSTLETLRKKAEGNFSGLILDLRNNPGGLLDSAVAIADAFIDRKPGSKAKLIVYTKGRIQGSQYVAYAHSGDVLKGAPIVVLINEGSASGSEIVAGALQDNHRALLIGTKSFGKGSVQTVLPLDASHGIKLTTALYYTPSGRSIQALGIEPDIIVDDVVIPKPTKEDNGLLAIKEADLEAHIANANGKEKVKEEQQKDKLKEKDAKKDLDLMYNDFQLYQALIMLKSMSVNNQK